MKGSHTFTAQSAMVEDCEAEEDLGQDQSALVIPDSTAFGMRVPVTLSTPTINKIVSVIKESEIDELFISLSGLRIYHLLARCWAAASLKDDTTVRWLDVMLNHWN